MSPSHEQSDFDELAAEAVAANVTDPELRRDLLLRLRFLALQNDPEVVAARQELAQATPAEIDAAFALAADRRSFDPSAAPAPDAPTLAERLAELARAVLAKAQEAASPIRQVFVAKLSLAGGVRWGTGAPVSFGPGASPSELTFVVPTDLVVAAGLAPIGRVEAGDGELRLFIPRRNDTPPPALVAVVDGTDHHSLAVMLVVKERSLEATVDWLEADAPQAVRLGVVAEEPPSG